MARARKLSKSNRTKVTIENYGKIAKALGINIGPKARPLCDQLQDKNYPHQRVEYWPLTCLKSILYTELDTMSNIFMQKSYQEFKMRF